MSLTLQQIQDTLELYAKSHTELNHTTGNKAFVRLYSKDELSAVKTACSRHVLLVLGLTSRIVGPADAYLLQRVLTLRFTSYAPTSEGSLGIQAALAKSEAILLDHYVKWLEEVEAGEYLRADCSWLRLVDWAQVAWYEIPEQPWLVNHYGWDMELPFRDELPAVDAAKWRPMEHSTEYSTEFQ